MAANSTRDVKVVCGTGSRYVNVDFGSYENPIEAISKKWKLTGDFIIQAMSGEKGEYIDIVDDEDLERFKHASELTVRLFPDAAHTATGRNDQEENATASTTYQQPLVSKCKNKVITHIILLH